MKITIKEIAKMANVSVATVSRVLNEQPKGVSEFKRREIQEIIEKYHYMPNGIAQSMKTNRTRCIGLLIPDILNPFFQNLARGVEDLAEAQGYHVFLCNTDNKSAKYINYIQAMMSKHVDGLIITGYPEDVKEKVGELLEPIKVVIIDRYIEKSSFCQITTDNQKAAYEMTKYLIKMGHRRIACITGPRGLYINEQRILGYEQALNEQGLQYDETLIREGTFEMSSGTVNGEWILAHTDATAIFCFNDMMAHGVYKACSLQKKLIPEELSVVGFDDVYISEIITPPLTTIKQPSYQMGEEAAELLIKWINDCPPNYKQITLSNEIVLRGSVKKLPD